MLSKLSVKLFVYCLFWEFSLGSLFWGGGKSSWLQAEQLPARRPESGVFVNYGTSIRTLTTFSGVFTTNSNGEKVYYGVTRDSNILRLFRFNVVKATVDLVIPIEDASGAWGLVLDRDMLYIGSYSYNRAYPASLYRYNLLTETLEKIGELQGQTHVWAMILAGDTLYLGTYPTASLFAYHARTGVLENLGSLSSEKYIRALETYQGKVYAGIGARAQLLEYDPDTGQTRDILPAEYREESFVYHLVRVGAKLFIGLRPSNDILMYDLRTRHFTLLMKASDQQPGDTPEFSVDTVHFTGLLGHLFEYHTKTGVFKKLTPPHSRALVGSHLVSEDTIAWVESNGLYQEVSADGVLRKTIDFFDFGLEGIANTPMSLFAYDDRVFLGGNRLRIFNVRSGQDTYHILPSEVKALSFLQGTLFTANYEYATIWAYPQFVLDDPARFQFNDSQFLLFAIADAQNRPLAMLADPRTQNIFIGTQPNYGEYGGALTYYNSSFKNEPRTYRHIVPQHSIRSLACDATNPNHLFLGTDVYGGTGIDPLPEEAHVVKWDLAGETILFDVVVSAKPAHTNQFIRSMAHKDHKLYLVTSNLHLVVLDSVTGAVLLRDPEQVISILASADGNLYGINSKSFFTIHPETLKRKYLKTTSEPIHRLFTEDPVTHTIYFISGNDLWGFR